MLSHIDHILIAAENLELTSKKMEALLGREVSWAGEHPSFGTSNHLFRMGDFYIEIIAISGKGAYADWLAKHLEQKGEGIFGLCFSTPNAEQCAAFFKANGLRDITIEDGFGVDRRTQQKRHWRLVRPSLKQMGGLFIFAIEHQSDDKLLKIAPQKRGREVVQNLDHIVITTNHIEEISTLFTARLGLRLALDKTVPEWGNRRQLFFPLKGKFIEVISKTAPVPDEASAEKKIANDFWGLAWKINDIDAYHRDMSANDSNQSPLFDLSPVRTGRKKGTKVLTIRDAPAQIPTLIIADDKP